MAHQVSFHDANEDVSPSQDYYVSQPRISVLDYWALNAAPFSRIPDEIIADRLYLSNAASAANFSHIINLGVTHVINLAGTSNFWEKQEDVDKALEEIRMKRAAN